MIFLSLFPTNFYKCYGPVSNPFRVRKRSKREDALPLTLSTLQRYLTNATLHYMHTLGTNVFSDRSEPCRNRNMCVAPMNHHRPFDRGWRLLYRIPLVVPSTNYHWPLLLRNNIGRSSNKMLSAQPRLIRIRIICGSNESRSSVALMEYHPPCHL